MDLKNICQCWSLIKTHDLLVCIIIKMMPYNSCSQMLHISLKTEKSFIAHPLCMLSVVGLGEYSAHDWRAATSVQRAPVTRRQWGLCLGPRSWDMDNFTWTNYDICMDWCSNFSHRTLSMKACSCSDSMFIRWVPHALPSLWATVQSGWNTWWYLAAARTRKDICANGCPVCWNIMRHFASADWHCLHLQLFMI